MPPSGVTVELDASELASLARDLRRVSQDNRKRLMAELAKVGEDAARGRIQAGGPGPDGERWPPRHPLSDSRKTLLNREDGLLKSLDSAADATTARWGSNVVYSRIHQFGGVIRPRRRRMLRFELSRRVVFARQVAIPPRPYLGWGDAERRDAAVVIERWLDQAFARGTA